MAEKRYLNVQYGNKTPRINVTDMGALLDLQEKIKSIFSNKIHVDVTDIELWKNDSNITTWSNLVDLPLTYFAEGGAAVVIKLANQGLIY